MDRLSHDRGRIVIGKSPCRIFAQSREDRRPHCSAPASEATASNPAVAVKSIRSAVLFPRVAEMALAHTVGNKAEAAYRRGDLAAVGRAAVRRATCPPPSEEGQYQHRDE